jgi:peptidoglycan hydrolase CwlO-like protein
MILEDFNALSDEEKTSYLKSIETDQKKIEDLTAERDSFKTENDSLRSQVEQTNKELKATKELNFTMARKINIGSKDDPETTLYNFMKGMK